MRKILIVLMFFALHAYSAAETVDAFILKGDIENARIEARRIIDKDSKVKYILVVDFFGKLLSFENKAAKLIEKPESNHIVFVKSAYLDAMKHLKTANDFHGGILSNEVDEEIKKRVASAEKLMADAVAVKTSFDDAAEKENKERMIAEAEKRANQERVAQEEDKARRAAFLERQRKEEKEAREADRMAAQKTKALKEQCGSDYRNLYVGMTLARAKQCYGDFKLKSQAINENGVIVSRYWKGSTLIDVVNGQIFRFSKP